MATLAWHLAESLTPLRLAVDDRAALEDLLRRLGRPAHIDDAAHATVADLFDVAASLDDVAAALVGLTEGNGDAAGHAVTIVEGVTAIAAALASLGARAEALAGELPAPLDDPATWSELAADLPVLLLTEHLRRHLGPLFGLLGLTGVLAPPDAPRTADDQRLVVRFDRITELIGDPAGRLSSQYGWGNHLEAAGLLWWIHRFAVVLGLDPRLGPVPQPIADDLFGGRQPALPALTVDVIDAGLPDGIGRVSVGGLVVPIGPASDLAGEPVGLYVAPTLWGETSGRIALSSGWALDLDVAADASGASGLSIRPGTVAHETAAPAPTGTIALEYEPAEPLVLLGDTGTRLVLHGFRAAVSVGSGLEPSAELAALGDGLELIVAPADGDGLVSFLLGALDLSVKAPLSVAITRSGIELAGGIGFTVTIPLDLHIGPITVRAVHASLTAGTDALTLQGTLDLEGQLGPLAASVSGLGARLELTEGADSLGIGVAAAGGFVPPNQIGFTISEGVITGGGFLRFDPGRYSGALSLDFLSVGIDAITVIDTEIPGNPGGWALFASLSARFPGVPLGFGFTLLGVGGILALDRTMDAEALAAGLRTGVIDALLFPNDPVGESAQLIAQIDDYFPLMPGNTVVGPVVMLGWGTPTIITAQLGVVVSLPDGVIAVMGSVAALLPVPDAPLLTLNMDCLGVVDVAAGTFSLSASLYDSRLLATIDLGGDMAMYLRATDQPYFLLSVGGYHPSFRPPSTVPASMNDLGRMSASIDIADVVTVTIQAYFAVTSNSVQFGSSVNLEASVEIWPTTYTARGWFEFDVLLIFSPFRIVADMSAGVGIYAGNKELMGVDLAAHLEGPEPWFASGYASFKFFGLKVEFAIEVGGQAVGEPKPIAHPRADVLAALALPSSWQEAGPIGGLGAGITYLTPAEQSGDTVWVRPDHQLTVRQSIAPLDRTLEIVGQAVPAAGEELLHITAVEIGNEPADVTSALDWFAPAQFEELDRAEKLARASFEEMNAGVTFGHAEAEIAADELTTWVDTAYEEDEWVEEEGSLADSAHSGAAGMALAHTQSRATPAFVIASTEYALVNALDGTVASAVPTTITIARAGMSQFEALRDRSRRIADDPRARSQFVVVPVSAAVTPIRLPDIDPWPGPITPPWPGPIIQPWPAPTPAPVS